MGVSRVNSKTVQWLYQELSTWQAAGKQLIRELPTQTSDMRHVNDMSEMCPLSLRDAVPSTLLLVLRHPPDIGTVNHLSPAAT